MYVSHSSWYVNLHVTSFWCRAEQWDLRQLQNLQRSAKRKKPMWLACLISVLQKISWKSNHFIQLLFLSIFWVNIFNFLYPWFGRPSSLLVERCWENDNICNRSCHLLLPMTLDKVEIYCILQEQRKRKTTSFFDIKKLCIKLKLPKKPECKYWQT